MHFSVVMIDFSVNIAKPTQKEIDEYMEKRGFVIHDGTCVIESYLITDLAPRNFVKDNDGKLYCIDPMICLKY